MPFCRPCARLRAPAAASFALVALLAALLGCARAGASIEDVAGLYRLIKGNAKCATTFNIDNLRKSQSRARINTNQSICDNGEITMTESPKESEGDAVTKHLVKQDVKQVGTVVLATVDEPVVCDEEAPIFGIEKNKFLNILRPRLSFDYLLRFVEGEYYLVQQRTSENNSCIFKRTRSSGSGVPGDPNGGGGTTISMWAWLGPLVGLAVLLLMFMGTLLVMKKRESRWYPFPSGSPDMDEAAFFGRISNTSPRRPGSLDVPRGPSGVVFEPGSTVAVPQRVVNDHSESRTEEARSPVQLQAVPNLSWNSTSSSEESSES